MRNPSFEKAGDAYYNQEKPFLFHLIPDGPNVIMDCGCAAGRLGRKLLELKKASEVIGLEIFEPAAREAMKVYKRVHVGDIETMDLDYKEYFDIVICGDILEHLKEPRNLVQQIHRMLKKGGILICCVPNIRYWRIWRDVIFKGDFRYTAEGILDQTHLRFFTSRSLRRMLTEASFSVDYTGMKMAVGPKQQAFNFLTFGGFSEFFGFQIIMLARKK
jgi:2-polyprenyl-3-methyl-5-hydroxy-6-metoxy-1,4-benzoquinol methylase